MSTVHVCDFDGQVIPNGSPYLQISDAKEITVTGGVQYVKNHGSWVTFHDGLCAAGWLGKLGIGAPKEVM